MAKDERDILDVLKFELNFLEQGGYGRSVRTPWKPTSFFLDSITCINFCDPKRTLPCTDCLLMDFVPPEQRDQEVPCHHIPLDQSGETLDSATHYDNQQELEEKLKCWLRQMIGKIEAQRAAAVVANK
jgi:hypothetical protein